MTYCFTYLLWAYSLTDSEFSCLARLPKPYPVSGPTYMPEIPSLLYGMSTGANEVLGTVSEARRMSVFHDKNFSLPICD